MRWHTRTYIDPDTGDTVCRYISLDRQYWMVAYTTEERDAREQARRSITADDVPPEDEQPVDLAGVD